MLVRTAGSGPSWRPFLLMALVTPHPLLMTHRPLVAPHLLLTPFWQVAPLAGGCWGCGRLVWVQGKPMSALLRLAWAVGARERLAAAVRFALVAGCEGGVEGCSWQVAPLAGGCWGCRRLAWVQRKPMSALLRLARAVGARERLAAAGRQICASGWVRGRGRRLFLAGGAPCRWVLGVRRACMGPRQARKRPSSPAPGC
jgi:hypothetical protein